MRGSGRHRGGGVHRGDRGRCEQAAGRHLAPGQLVLQLHDAGAIELVGEERIRGGVAKRYRYNVDRPAPGRAEASAEDRQVVYAALAAELRRRSALVRVEQHGHLTDAELWVDPEVWTVVRERVGAASADLHRAARPPRTPGTIRVSATMALFEMAP